MFFTKYFTEATGADKNKLPDIAAVMQSDTQLLDVLQAS